MDNWDDFRKAIATAREGVGIFRDAAGLAGQLRDIITARKKDTPLDAFTLVTNLSHKLLDAHVAQLQTLNLVLDLERALEQAHRRQQEADRYELVTFPGSGALVLALKPDDPKREPPHYLCHPCLEDGHKRILQPAGGYRPDLLECPRCKTQHATKGRPQGSLRTDWSPV